MKSINSFGLHFNLRTEKERDRKAPVYVGIMVMGEEYLLPPSNSLVFSAGITVKF